MLITNSQITQSTNKKLKSISIINYSDYMINIPCHCLLNGLSMLLLDRVTKDPLYTGFYDALKIHQVPFLYLHFCRLYYVPESFIHTPYLIFYSTVALFSF